MDVVEFGRYRLIEVIGEGGMGTVYKAHDTTIGRDVAIKVLPTELGAEPGYRERFRREAHTAARLTEPHIIPIYDTGEIEGHLYLVMPVLDGIDVHGLLKRDGPMTPQRAVRVIEQLAAALNAAHEHGLVHRDVKPSNALLTGDDFVYLIDFGIAHDAAATRLTSTGMIVGTLAYMAPERFLAGTADARADVYSLACVLYECLTGATPYAGDSIERQIAGHLNFDPPKPSRVSPAIPAGFDGVIAAGMAKNPDQRYQSARELATAAHHALTTTPSRNPHTAPGPTLLDAQVSPSPPPHWAPAPHVRPAYRPPAQIGTPPTPWGPRQRRRLKWPLIGATAAILAAAGITGYLVWPHPSQTPTAQPAPTSSETAPSAPTSGETAQPAPTSGQTAQPAPTSPDPAALAPFVGHWGAHEQGLEIDSTGTGNLRYPDFRLCPNCSQADAPTGTLVFMLTSVSNGVASGSVTASSDAQNHAVGEPVTAQIAPGLQGKGVVLQITIGGIQQVPFCNSTSAGQCGA